MELMHSLLPILIYFLIAMLIVVLIILVVKLIDTVDKANVLLDDLQKKSDSLNGVFGAVDSITNTLGSFNFKMASSFANIAEKVYSIFRNKSDKKEEEDDE